MTAPAQTLASQPPTSSDSPGDGTPDTSGSLLLIPAVAVVVGVALGVLTAYAQGWLPDELGSLANSSGSWVVIAFLLALPARGAVIAAVTAAAALLALLGGYVIGAGLAGHPSSSALITFWSAAAVVAGPALGVSAHWIRFAPRRLAALGSGAVAGVLIGEGWYGLTVVADSTYPPFWVAEIVAGVAVLCVIGGRRLRRAGPILVSLGTAAVVAAAFVIVYSEPLMQWL